MNEKLMPHFIIIGAMKCGTSTLYRNLVELPYITPAIKKEVHFFDKKYELGLDWYRDHFPLLLDYKENYVTGEASPRYIIHPDVPKRVFETMPQVKLIALLRNPIDRAYSHYHHMSRKGKDTLSFEDAITKEMEEFNNNMEKALENYKTLSTSYLTRGVYADQLKRWMNLFPKEQFLILKSEDFFTDPQIGFKQVTDFLDLPNWEYTDHKQWNVGSYSKMEDHLRKRLTEFFRPHNQRLYEFLGRDFGWEKE